MATIFIHYFSGTGNTAHSVKLMADKLTANGHETQIIQVKKDSIPTDTIPDFHIFAFPIFSWAAPVLMQKYIAQMPRSKGTKTAILAINGAIVYNGELVKGYTGQALEQVEKVLRRKKYDIFLTGNASFPDNWTQFTNPCTTDDVQQIFPVGEAEVISFTEKFISGEKSLYRCGLGNKIWSFAIAFLFDYIGRRALGKFYIADEHCTGCQICAKSCPANTIKMKDNKPYWKINCEDCNRCINICPEKAIQVSMPILIFQLTTNLGLTILAIWTIVEYAPQIISTSPLLLFVIEAFAIVAATILLFLFNFYPVDACINYALKIPALRRFASKGITKNFRRYSAPGFKPLASN